MHDVFTWPVGRARQSYDVSVARAAPFRPVMAYMIATALGGAALGTALGLSGTGLRHGLAVPESTLLTGGAPVALLAAACQLAGRVSPLPERRAQVPTRWLQWRHRSATAAAFGLMIGAGALTYLRHATAWVLAVLLLAAPSWWVAAAGGAIYGITRGSPLLITWIIDRGTRHRPRWERLGATRARAPLALAPLGLITYFAAILFSIG